MAARGDMTPEQDNELFNTFLAELAAGAKVDADGNVTMDPALDFLWSEIEALRILNEDAMTKRGIISQFPYGVTIESIPNLMRMSLDDLETLRRRLVQEQEVIAAGQVQREARRAEIDRLLPFFGGVTRGFLEGLSDEAIANVARGLAEHRGRYPGAEPRSTQTSQTGPERGEEPRGGGPKAAKSQAEEFPLGQSKAAKAQEEAALTKELQDILSGEDPDLLEWLESVLPRVRRAWREQEFPDEIYGLFDERRFEPGVTGVTGQKPPPGALPVPFDLLLGRLRRPSRTRIGGALANPLSFEEYLSRALPQLREEFKQSRRAEKAAEAAKVQAAYVASQPRGQTFFLGR